MARSGTTEVPAVIDNQPIKKEELLPMVPRVSLMDAGAFKCGLMEQKTLLMSFNSKGLPDLKNPRWLKADERRLYSYRHNSRPPQLT